MKCLSGSMGKQIAIREVSGQTIVSKYRGPSAVPLTDAQLTVPEQFAKAFADARKAKRDETLAALYQSASTTGHSACNLSLRQDLNYNCKSKVSLAIHIFEIHSKKARGPDCQ